MTTSCSPWLLPKPRPSLLDPVRLAKFHSRANPRNLDNRRNPAKIKFASRVRGSSLRLARKEPSKHHKEQLPSKPRKSNKDSLPNSVQNAAVINSPI